jgi:uncharacterized SAM-dependent methyltransferase
LIDVSAAALAVSMRALSAISNVRVLAHEAPYEAGLAEAREQPGPDGKVLTLFLGSNIGNFDPPGAAEFLRDIRASIRTGDFFLLGVDLIKPEPLLQLAYDDPLGVTAAFNRNLLVRINRQLGGDFDLGAFSHRAFWNEPLSRVEMHLVSRKHQVVRVEAAGLEISFEEGESIWTESSYKYRPESVITLGGSAGFRVISQWIDVDDQFALTLFEATSGP